MKTIEQARAELARMAGVDGGRRQWGYFPTRNYTAGGQAKAPSERPGTFTLQYGQTPTPAQVMQYFVANGGKLKRQATRAQRAGDTPQPRYGSTAPQLAPTAQERSPALSPVDDGDYYRNLMMRAADEHKAQLAAANAANQARADRIDQSKIDNYNRVMGGLDNWGNVQSQLNEERAAESLADVKAFAAERGLGNSTVVSAAQQRNARDLALVQQDLSEKKDARRLGYDIDMTRDLDAFIERQVDQAPDPSNLMQIYAQAGQAEGIRQGREQQAAQAALAAAQASASGSGDKRRRIKQLPALGGFGGGVSPAAARHMAAQMQGNFWGGLNGAAGFFQPVNAGPVVTSNRYPTKRSNGAYGLIQQRINDNNEARRNRARANNEDPSSHWLARAMRKQFILDEDFKGRVPR